MKRTIEQPSTAHAPPTKKIPYFIPRAGNPPSPPPGVAAEMCSFDICSKRLTENDAKKLADHDRSFHRRHAVHVILSSRGAGGPSMQQQTIERHVSGYYFCPHRPCIVQAGSSSSDGGSSSNSNHNNSSNNYGPFRCYNKDSFITHCRRAHGLEVQKLYSSVAADSPFLSLSSTSSATAAAVAAAAGGSSRFNPLSLEEGGGLTPILPTGSTTDNLLLQLLLAMEDIKTAINIQSKTITKAINKQSAAITAAINEQTEVLREHTAAINNHTAAINDQYE
ncbi:hypothetical protein EC957_011533 [Mortierella hygrophila]|uniref:Uncharacterized protein n=1 Tax=Mortierella hygrophila TaxID=979708 RepID=A0A9P6F999_9FUNG|nr:hypothetical protein EC957_011533 [Mortierella hygrophila]